MEDLKNYSSQLTSKKALIDEEEERKMAQEREK